MLAAVPLFGQDVAPRFGFSKDFLIVEIENEQAVSVTYKRTTTDGWLNRLCELRDLGVAVILCGGYNRAFIPLAEDMGLQVIAGLAGDARQIAEAFARGESMTTFGCGGGFRPGGRHSRNRNRGGGLGRGRCYWGNHMARGAKNRNKQQR